jgi:hypothetical protein
MDAEVLTQSLRRTGRMWCRPLATPDRVIPAKLVSAKLPRVSQATLAAPFGNDASKLLPPVLARLKAGWQKRFG